MSQEEHPKVGRRPDDFEQRREHLKEMSDDQLRRRFWQLTDDIVNPLIELARTHTSPSIERSVLLRMGFSSVEAKELVQRIQDAGLLGKGAGHVLLKIARANDLQVREAGLAMLEGQYLEQMEELFAPGGDR